MNKLIVYLIRAVIVLLICITILLHCVNVNSFTYGLYTPRSRQYVLWGRAGKFKIELNRNTLVSESDTVRSSVLVHELGHAFCLDDNPSSRNSSIMNYDRDRDYLTWPTSDDIAGVNAAYAD